MDGWRQRIDRPPRQSTSNGLTYRENGRFSILHVTQKDNRHSGFPRIVMEPIINIFVSTWPFWVFALMVAALIMLIRTYVGPRRMPYRRRERLVTKAELRFYRSLRKAVLDDWEIFAMVRIADLLRVEPNARNRRSWVGQILAKHVDFVLCQPESLAPVLCIELDDSSHQRADRIKRDEFVDQAFESAGLPLLRVPVQSNYDSRELRELIRKTALKS